MGCVLSVTITLAGWTLALILRWLAIGDRRTHSSILFFRSKPHLNASRYHHIVQKLDVPYDGQRRLSCYF